MSVRIVCSSACIHMFRKSSDSGVPGHGGKGAGPSCLWFPQLALLLDERSTPCWSLLRARFPSSHLALSLRRVPKVVSKFFVPFLFSITSAQDLMSRWGPREGSD